METKTPKVIKKIVKKVKIKKMINKDGQDVFNFNEFNESKSSKIRVAHRDTGEASQQA